jgi:CheY-like chemotaxis protein
VVIDINRSALEVCGFERQDVLGRPFWECGWWNRSPDVIQKTDQPVNRAADGHVIEAALPESSATVLLVDDDNDLRCILAGALATLGYEVREATDGLSALQILETFKPDVVVVDFAMPGLNGADVVKKAREKWPDLPIVLASGFAETAAIERAIGRDARLLRKPFRIDELLEAVAKATEGS